MFPNTKITPNAKLLESNLVEVKPLGPPIDYLFYVDYVYETLLEIRNKKILKITKRMK